LTLSLRHWLKFNAVGMVGVAVQLLALAVFKSGLRLNTMTATFLAVETAVLHNFFWHERWTWIERTRVKTSVRDVLSRLIRFNMANGLISIAGNLLLMWILVDRIHLQYLAANLIAIGTCSLINFLVSDRFVF
jgi:putative flippase GtrA